MRDSLGGHNNMLPHIVSLASVVITWNSGAIAQDTGRSHLLLPERGVVLQPSLVEKTGVRSCLYFNLPHVSAFWTPTPRQIQVLDSVLAPVMADDFAALGQMLPEGTPPPGAQSFLDGGYYRQYMGIVSNGHRLIFVNGFDQSYLYLRRESDSIDIAAGKHPKPLDWRTTLVQDCGGGPFFFEALYDPSSRAILRFDFNHFD
jgi:hypothetical protein